MHGRKRETWELTGEEKVDKADKIAKYNRLKSAILDRNSKQVYDDVGDQVSAKLAALNPDFYSLFNYRRELLSSFFTMGRDKAALCMAELKLTELGLAKNPKSYPAWSQREWVLAQGTTDLQQELALCTKYLNLDSRNFHCWNYRRFVVSRIGMHASLEGELAFTLEKINQDFSNYSAWHYRSVLLPQRFEEGDALDAMLDAEFELVQQAFYTEPEDQSAWLYHRWLLGRVALPGFRLPGVSLGMSDLAHGFGVAVDLKETTGAVKGELSTSPAPPKERHVVRQRAVFERELASCLELLELEPHCKWVLLTSAVLLSGVQACRTTSHTPDDEQHDEAAARITDIFVTLESLDPLRSQYYSSIRRKLLDRFHSI